VNEVDWSRGIISGVHLFHVFTLHAFYDFNAMPISSSYRTCITTHKKAQAAQQFESQKKKDEMTEAEKEELAVRKTREEGTPVNDSTFASWWSKFQQEQEEAALAEGADNAKGDDDEKLTGFQIFSEKAGVFSLEKLEAAAEELENDTSALDPEELGVDEDLFDDDEDFDDLDFESDDEDDSDEEPDI
jgi:hypothetical protein